MGHRRASLQGRRKVRTSLPHPLGASPCSRPEHVGGVCSEFRTDLNPLHHVTSPPYWTVWPGARTPSGQQCPGGSTAEATPCVGTWPGHSQRLPCGGCFSPPGSLSFGRKRKCGRIPLPILHSRKLGLKQALSAIPQLVSDPTGHEPKPTIVSIQSPNACLSALARPLPRGRVQLQALRKGPW